MAYQEHNPQTVSDICTLTKKTNQWCLMHDERKGSRSLDPPSANCPSKLAKIGRFGKSLCSAKTLFPLFAAMLGSVKWNF